MGKSTVRWWVIWTGLLIMYNVITFSIPFPKTPVFFISWIFTLIAIFAQIYVIRTAFGRDETVKSTVYGFPIAKLGAIYLIVQLVLGLVFMSLGATAPTWLSLVLYVVLLGVAIVGLIATDAVRNEVERQDVKIEKDTSYMRNLQIKVMALPNLVSDLQLRSELSALADSFRFSDPTSSADLQDAEMELSACVDALTHAVDGNDSEAIRACLQKTMSALERRNALCKQMKYLQEV